MSDNIIVERMAAYNSASKVGRVSDIAPSRVSGPALPEGAKSFAEVLREQSGLKFSAHAQQRLDQRQISISPTELSRLSKAVSDAEAKGSKDTLVLLNNKAFIVSVANKTVVTALGGGEEVGKVFTNIDSTVVA